MSFECAGIGFTRRSGLQSFSLVVSAFVVFVADALSAGTGARGMIINFWKLVPYVAGKLNIAGMM